MTEAGLHFANLFISRSYAYKRICLCAQWFPRGPSLPSCRTASLGSTPLWRWRQTDWPAKQKKQANAADTWSSSGTRTSRCEDTPQITDAHDHRHLYRHLHRPLSLLKAFTFFACTRIAQNSMKCASFCKNLFKTMTKAEQWGRHLDGTTTHIGSHVKGLSVQIYS